MSILDALRASDLSPAVKWTLQRYLENEYFSKINAMSLKVLQSLAISSLVCRIHAEKLQGEEAIHSQLAIWLPGRVVIELETYQAYLPQGAGVDVVMLLRRFLKAKPTSLAKKATTKKGKASEAAASTNDWSGAQIFTEGKKLSSFCVNHFNIYWKKALTKAFNGIEGSIPSGKQLGDVLTEVAQALWTEKEEKRIQDRIKRSASKSVPVQLPVAPKTSLAPFTTLDEADNHWLDYNVELHKKFGYHNTGDNLVMSVVPDEFDMEKLNANIIRFKAMNADDSAFLCSRWLDKFNKTIQHNISSEQLTPENSSIARRIQMDSQESVSQLVDDEAVESADLPVDEEEDGIDLAVTVGTVTVGTVDKSSPQEMPVGWLPCEWLACMLHGPASEQPDPTYITDTVEAEQKEQQRRKRILDQTGLGSGSGGSYSRQRMLQQAKDNSKEQSFIAAVTRNESRNERRLRGDTDVSEDEGLSKPSMKHYYS